VDHIRASSVLIPKDFSQPSDLRSAAQSAARAFAESCPTQNAFLLTPTGRLSSMPARLEGTLAAVETVRPALEAFYNSLSDEQKERFNALGPRNTPAKTETTAAAPAPIAAPSRSRA